MVFEEINLMQEEEKQIVLERRSGRKMLGCLLIVIPIGWIIGALVEPDKAGLVGSFLGFLLLMGLFSMATDFSKNRRIVVTPYQIQFSEGIFKATAMTISWDELGEVDYSVNVSRAENGVKSTTCIIYLNRKGAKPPGKPHRIDYSDELGRQVKNSSRTIHAEEAVQLIEKLRVAGSEGERIEIINNNKAQDLQEL